MTRGGNGGRSVQVASSCFSGARARQPPPPCHSQPPPPAPTCHSQRGFCVLTPASKYSRIVLLQHCSLLSSSLLFQRPETKAALTLHLQPFQLTQHLQWIWVNVTLSSKFSRSVFSHFSKHSSIECDNFSPSTCIALETTSVMGPKSFFFAQSSELKILQKLWSDGEKHKQNALKGEMWSFGLIWHWVCSMIVMVANVRNTLFCIL